MAYQNFQEVAALDSAAQRHLLLNGEPTERVWAAWALGVQFGKTINPDLIASIEQSPHPGTRRQLIVMLAGHGEHSILKALAQHDPDEYVRATACQYLIQTAQANDTQLEELLMRSLNTDQAIVCQAILTGAKTGYPRLSQKMLTPFLNHPDLETRYVALTALLSQQHFMADVVAEQILKVTDRDLRIALVNALISSGNSRKLLGITQDASEPLVLEILGILSHVAAKIVNKILIQIETAQITDDENTILLVVIAVLERYRQFLEGEIFDEYDDEYLEIIEQLEYWKRHQALIINATQTRKSNL
jgi:hypothetical protein